MSKPELLEPKTVEIKTMKGETLRVVLSKFPALVGRELITQYPLTAAPKLGSYEANQALALKLLAHVGIERIVKGPHGDEPYVVQLTDATLVNAHVPDGETLMRIEYAMLEYNTSFFNPGELSNILERMVQTFAKSAMKMWTGYSQSLSPKE